MSKQESTDKILQNKMFLLETLSEDANIILQHVHESKLITRRDYKNLSDVPGREKQIIGLLDKIMGRGEQTCSQFIDLLRKDCVLEIFPMLRNHSIFDSPVNEVSQIDLYKIESNPRGVCVIINNVSFTSMDERRGSDKDQWYLDKVFRWLGFEVVVHKNKAAADMKNLLEDLRTRVKGDCFVCCVLSHGVNDGVCGTDGGVVSVDEIREPFNGVNCQSLAGKPKLFILQTCRGKKNQNQVKVQADAPDDGESKMEVDGGDFDIAIPADTDFLIARSTIDNHVSYRNVEDGSWFIQTLCRNLEKHCPLRADIQTILLHVNDEVSKLGIRCKQMPIHEVAMRKKLILPPVDH